MALELTVEERSLADGSFAFSVVFHNGPFMVEVYRSTSQHHAGSVARELNDVLVRAARLGHDMGSAEATLAKARIVAEIVRIIRARRLTQTAAAKILGLSQPKISALLNGQFQGYSKERLIWLLNRLGCDVQIVVKSAPRRRAVRKVSIAFA